MKMGFFRDLADNIITAKSGVSRSFEWYTALYIWGKFDQSSVTLHRFATLE